MDEPILKDGFCTKHNLHFSECYECFERWQKQQGEKWLNRHRQEVLAGKFINMRKRNIRNNQNI